VICISHFQETSCQFFQYPDPTVIQDCTVSGELDQRLQFANGSPQIFPIVDITDILLHDLDLVIKTGNIEFRVISHWQNINSVFYYRYALLIHMPLTKFEKARIIGARALQISMGAPVIIDVPKNLIDPVDIAMLEYDNNVIPITIKR
jgi:DNA-directed RNA polymerase subunit K